MEIQKLLRHSCSAGQVESTMLKLQLGQDSGSFQCVPTEKVSRLRQTLAAEIEGINILDDAQVRLAAVGERFVKHVERMKEHHGEVFTMRLVRHCNHLAAASPDSTINLEAWKLFGSWWKRRDASYANLVFGDQALSQWCQKLLTSNLYGKLAADYFMTVGQAYTK